MPRGFIRTEWLHNVRAPMRNKEWDYLNLTCQVNLTIYNYFMYKYFTEFLYKINSGRRQ